jgi:transposase
MAARVLLREISSEEGNRLLRIVRRTSGSVVTWRRAQIVLLSAQGISPSAISEVVFTDPDTVRDVIHNFNADGFDALYPRYRGGRPQTFTLLKRHEIKRIALSDPQDLGQPFATWSLSRLADYLVAEGVVTDISHEGLRQPSHPGARPERRIHPGVYVHSVELSRRDRDRQLRERVDGRHGRR